MLVLKQHVVDWRQANAGTQDVVDASSLAEQGIHKWSTSRDKRSLAQETQDRQHRVKTAHDKTNKKLSYRRRTARCVVSIEILPIATQQCRNYLYDKSLPNRWYKVGDLVGGNA